MHKVPPAGFETLLGVGSGPPSRQPCGHQTKSACMDAPCLRVGGDSLPWAPCLPCKPHVETCLTLCDPDRVPGGPRDAGGGGGRDLMGTGNTRVTQAHQVCVWTPDT